LGGWGGGFAIILQHGLKKALRGAIYFNLLSCRITESRSKREGLLFYISFPLYVSNKENAFYGYCLQEN
jgi:hypothetical protein